MSLSAPTIRTRKRRAGATPLVIITAYDEPGARLADAAGVDIILVGDSVGDNVLGRSSTMSVTVEEMCHHVAAVAAAEPAAHVVADMPWLSYHTSTAEAVMNAGALIRAGAHSVKLEGGVNRVAVVEAIVNAEIPVMGHVGLTPQSLLAMGGYKVQGKSRSAADDLVAAARALEGAGVYALVIEGVPAAVGRLVTEAVDVPTIGIGAGPDTDGQVLVFHDLLGLGRREPARFVRRYAAIGDEIQKAIAAYAHDVREGTFPSPEESYPNPDELA